MYIKNFTEFINEAFKDIDVSFIDNNIKKNKDKILEIVKTKNSNELINYLNLIFKNRFKTKEKTVVEVDRLITELRSEIDKRRKKMFKYPEIKEILKSEIEEDNLFIKYLNNKQDSTLKFQFYTFDSFYKVDKSSVLKRIMNWIDKKLNPVITIKYMQYNNKEKTKIKQFDFRLIEAMYYPVTNQINVIYDNDFINSINKDNINQFGESLRVVLKHELVHQRDYLNKSISDFKSYGDHPTVHYHVQNSEIKSWAAGAIEEMKLNNLTNEEIKRGLLYPNKNMNVIRISESVMNYYNYYNTYKFVYYMFVSECLDVLDEEYENEKIK